MDALGKMEKLQPVCVALATLAVLGVLAGWNPSQSVFFPRCFVHLATGLHCPGCGTQRALHHLLHGRVLVAAHFNLLTVGSLPILLAGFVRWTLHVYHSRWQIHWRAPAAWIWALFVAVIAFTVLRNVPRFPFTLLAPPW